jgi:hypothetical protein
MKTIIQILIVILGVSIANAQSNTKDEIKRIDAMNSALAGGGINGLLQKANEQSWRVPQIPSQWHVEHVSKPERKPVDIAARAFGKRLAQSLDQAAPSMQQLPAGEPLFNETARLLALSEWCAATDGYGNLFLAQRSLDIAAVGVARLAANLDFPIGQNDGLLARMNPTWMGIETNQRVLNQDAGAAIFMVLNRDEMERTYGSGQRLLAEQRNPSLFAERQKNSQQWRLFETPALKANLSFFDPAESSQAKPTVTLLTTWDLNWHGALVVGLELQSIRKAKALAGFRKAIGAFPEKPVFTAQQLRDRERGAAEAARAGLKVSNIEDSYSSPRAAAFALAWKSYLEKQGEDLGKLPPSRYNLDSSAFQAYDEVQRGEFFDRDTANMQQHEERMKKAEKANP